MNMALLFPAGLIALLSLALPVLIHLRRRSQYQPIEFAALRWLVAHEVPRRQIRLDERWLLALRLLLLVLFALLLASPVFFRENGQRSWVVVVPGADWRALPANSTAPDAEWHWLAPEFPEFTQPTPAGQLPVSSLLRELDSRLDPDVPLTAVVPAQLHGLDGARLLLSRSIEWQVVPSLPTPNAVATEPSTALIATVAIRHADDPESVAAIRWLNAATQAWNADSAAPSNDLTRTEPAAFRIDSANHSKPIPNDSKWLIWVSDAPLPDELEQWVRGGGVALMIGAAHALPPDQGVHRWRSSSGTAVDTMQLGAGRLLALPQPLALSTVPELIEPSFPEVLRDWLQEVKPAPQVALASSQRPQQGQLHWPPVPIALSDALLLAIVALWGLERWLSTRATRATP